MEKTTDFINLWQTLSHNQYTLITTDRSQTQNNEVVSGIDCISELEVDNFNCIFRQCCEEEKSRKCCSVSTQWSSRHKFKIEWKCIFHYIVFVLFLLFSLPWLCPTNWFELENSKCLYISQLICTCWWLGLGATQIVTIRPCQNMHRNAPGSYFKFPEYLCLCHMIASFIIFGALYVQL